MQARTPRSRFGSPRPETRSRLAPRDARARGSRAGRERRPRGRGPPGPPLECPGEARQNAPLRVSGGPARRLPPRAPPPPRGTAGTHSIARAEGESLSPAPFRITTAAATDVGLRRSGNEDSFSLWSDEGGGAHAAHTLLVVCDGMGGSNAGEVASRIDRKSVV